MGAQPRRKLIGSTVSAFEATEGGKKLGTFSWGIANDAHLQRVLGTTAFTYRPTPADARKLDGVVAWGCKPNTEAAQRYCQAHGVPLWRMEDGFLRSVGLGVDGEPALSLVLDAKGMYYDARTPSELEHLLQGNTRDGATDQPGEEPSTVQDALADRALLARARRCIDRIVSGELSKYNDSPAGKVVLPGSPKRPKVLVVDQTHGDMSLRFGNVADGAFERMVEMALTAHPEADVVIKTHPDVLSGKRHSALGKYPPRDRVWVWSERANPIATLKAVEHVYCATSLLGFEALMVGKPVTCMGAPFYAGWGLTTDAAPLTRRTRTRSLEEVFAAAYILYGRYFDPDSGQPCEIERIIDHLALQRRQFEINAGRTLCIGFRRWKREHLRPYLRSPDNQVVFARSARHAQRLGCTKNDRIVVWGRGREEEVQALAASSGAAVHHVEDGFLRSVGLGSDFVAPSSLVFDRSGIYYDPSDPSDLESMLERHVFSEAQLARAQQLRHRLVEERVSKYNFRVTAALSRPDDGRRVVLVPGQVEDDASIMLGCTTTRTNAALIAEARNRCPDAYLVYKAHPDVVSGNRQGDVPVELLDRLVDRVESSATIDTCLEVADEVHTMTSLVGFEALLRGLTVTTHGRPFYSGWGLTTDLSAVDRRARRVSLDELVAATLLCYPCYVNPLTGQFTTAEATVDNIIRSRASQSLTLSSAGSGRWLRRAVRYGRRMLGVR